MTDRPHQGEGRRGGAPDDPALLDLVQRRTFRFFWDLAHPASGMTPERVTVGAPPGDLVATGASGFGAMAAVIGAERGWVERGEAARRLLRKLRFLEAAESHHGIFPHWMDGRTGATIAFSPDDDGGDLVETAFLFEGLLCARQYFGGAGEVESALRAAVDRLWARAEWDWHTRGGEDVLYWHWSPSRGFAMNLPIRGWNECLVAYVLAASSPTHPIRPEAYHRGWAGGASFRNGQRYYGIELPLGPAFGGPLCFAHYSFLGLDPRGLRDRYADYAEQNRRHALINFEHCVRNPGGFAGYGADCWGLTSDDTSGGYGELSPTRDLGFIAPNAALGSFPYLPDQAMAALRTFTERLGDRIFTAFGFTSSFSEAAGWFSRDLIGIDQGQILGMIENYRSGLLWRLFMSCPEIRHGLRRLDFEMPEPAGA
ncbi:glucoamylase family protein [Propylenella binzhouense]|uniref:Beta-glucosidase n=1 Tax=Propylenella binzhouense TaxID=2555902 RepID=A0A964T3H0_9HYPH|nr:glucoamylase family protein [Propylenella binzhouense]MYZ47530.1 beta-glucosidase [Propylenella binzhouense]